MRCSVTGAIAAMARSSGIAGFVQKQISNFLPIRQQRYISHTTHPNKSSRSFKRPVDEVRKLCSAAVLVGDTMLLQKRFQLHLELLRFSLQKK